MAQFYARIKGLAGEATRRGSKTSGVESSTMSWQGQINVHMWYDRANDSDWVTVKLGPHGQYARSDQYVVLYHGPVDGWRKEPMTIPEAA